MSEERDDDNREDTIMRAVRSAMQGVTAPRHGRRENDRLHLKDWLGWLLAIIMPISLGLVTMWKTVHISELKHEQHDERLDDLEESQAAQWERIGDLMRHDHE